MITQLLTMTLENRKRQDSCLLDEIGHFFPKQYVYGILAISNAISTDITYYDEKLIQRTILSQLMMHYEAVLHCRRL